MALVPCKECGNQISTLARTCPQCGAPSGMLGTPQTKPKREPSRVEKAIGGVILLAIAYGLFKSSTGTSEQADYRSGCEARDLQCIGKKFEIYAGYDCKRQVERFAKYSVKWIDKTFDAKYFRWADKAAGTVTLIGDSVQFQNGFGAYLPVTYECDLSADGKTVLEVRVNEGRLLD